MARRTDAGSFALAATSFWFSAVRQLLFQAEQATRTLPFRGACASESLLCAVASSPPSAEAAAQPLVNRAAPHANPSTVATPPNFFMSVPRSVVVATVPALTQHARASESSLRRERPDGCGPVAPIFEKILATSSVTNVARASYGFACTRVASISDLRTAATAALGSGGKSKIARNHTASA